MLFVSSSNYVWVVLIFIFVMVNSLVRPYFKGLVVIRLLHCPMITHLPHVIMGSDHAPWCRAEENQGRDREGQEASARVDYCSYLSISWDHLSKGYIKTASQSYVEEGDYIQPLICQWLRITSREHYFPSSSFLSCIGSKQFALV